jgi:hypothetical protein
MSPPRPSDADGEPPPTQDLTFRRSDPMTAPLTDASHARPRHDIARLHHTIILRLEPLGEPSSPHLSLTIAK